MHGPGVLQKAAKCFKSCMNIHNAMPIPEEHKNRHVYHFTLLDNLHGIVRDGLVSPNEQIRRKLVHHSIAAPDLQSKRARMPVTCGPKGVVHDYVPFYFTSLSPMLQAVVNAKNVDQYDLVHIALPVSMIERSDVIFTNAAANSNVPPQFYSDSSRLDQLHWDLIDPQNWKWTKEQKRFRMAEMLVHKEIRIQDVAYLVVWNKGSKEKVKRIFSECNIDPPPMEFSGTRRFAGHWVNHYFTTYWDKKHNVSIVKGPKELRKVYQIVVDHILAEGFNEDGQFKDLWEMRDALREDLAAVGETAELVGLESENDMHKEDVGSHTMLVVKNLRRSLEYKNLSKNDQLLTEIAAFFHDIGKGPKERWADKGGKQQVDNDHPAKSTEMLARIFTEEIKSMRPRSVRVISKLVCYHDLVGDILRGDLLVSRDPKQLEDIIETEAELDMLIALGLADMRSVNPRWAEGREEEIEALRERVLAKLDATEFDDE